MRTITLFFAACLSMVLSAHAGGGTGKFKAEIMIQFNTQSDAQELKFEFNSPEELKNFRIETIGSDQLAYVESTIVSVNAGTVNANYVSFKVKLSQHNNSEKANRVKGLCQLAIYAVQ